MIWAEGREPDLLDLGSLIRNMTFVGPKYLIGLPVTLTNQTLKY